VGKCAKNSDRVVALNQHRLRQPLLGIPVQEGFLTVVISDFSDAPSKVSSRHYNSFYYYIEWPRRENEGKRKTLHYKKAGRTIPLGGQRKTTLMQRIKTKKCNRNKPMLKLKSRAHHPKQKLGLFISLGQTGTHVNCCS